jgi:hypothetical protein
MTGFEAALCFSGRNLKACLLFSLVWIILLAMEKTFAYQTTMLCDHCVLTFVFATNTFKQYTTQYPLLLAAAVSNTTVNLHIFFLFIPRT